ncbi:HEAT repeat domain-containing protein [Xanthomonas campestris]|uniref:HEAT repeat domain-containing protein n=1 Tax=Xanthomonas campestris pv. papavericola TaxID=487881 RepID=A0AAJ3CF29_XANCA|nr:hypothetical protein [Xanthomonas campestris]MEC3888740.1 hypothetical protein [Xanthomonas campestris pv. papavericola]
MTLHLLSCALSSTLHTAVDADACTEVLNTLRGRHFPALDQYLRLHQRLYQADSRGPVARAVGATDLFIRACSPDGFVREKALRDFVQYPGRLALAAALLRCDDWVPQVQARAIDLVTSLIVADDSSLFDFLELLLALQERERFSEAVWQPLIVPRMRQLSSTAVNACWSATTHASAPARLFAYQTLSGAEPEIAIRAAQQAITDVAPSVARWGLAQAMKFPSRTITLTALAQGLRHPIAVIRAHALRLLAQLDANGARRAVEEALFSDTYVLRNAAIHLLKTCYGDAPINYYRDAIDTRDPMKEDNALIALADMATPEDAVRMRPWINHRRRELRAAALRIAERAKPDDFRQLVEQALTDSASKVVREALTLAENNGWLSRQLLEEHFAITTAPITQRCLISTAHRLDKWNGIAVLLQWYRTSVGETRNHAAREISHWIHSEPNKFAPLRAGLRLEITSALDALKQSDPSIYWDAIAFAVRSS